MTTAPRRLVLLRADGTAESVLAELPAAEMHDEIRRQAALYPGRLVAGEFLLRGEWRRFLVAGLPRDPAYFSEEGHHEPNHL